ncbi:hypothetical protein [Herminiimonas sp. CN]|uniref:hypothetical protein n=1 Tax=Herminiimonas sp. CN TaxID=1349818 RepID=UPI00047323C3|nr:hypothetical protein [Herminiimonas sp. CN]
MRSTEDDKLREVVGTFFDDVLMPMAKRMRASGIQPFPVQPDVSRLSYYARRSTCSMTRDDFTAPSCIDFEDFERRLAAHWTALGRSELAGEAARIADLARAAHAAFAGNEQDAEISPYIYVMF